MEEAFFTEKTLLLLNETQLLFDGHQRLVHTLRTTLKKPSALPSNEGD
jgi:hypothetical protein